MKLFSKKILYEKKAGFQYDHFDKSEYDYLMQTQWLSLSELDSLQESRLKALINHAYNHVPYYKKIFDERGLHPKDIRNAADLSKLPILEKKDIISNFCELKALNSDRDKEVLLRTAGTTSVPMSFLVDRKTLCSEAAFVWRFWSWAGINFEDRCAIIRGNRPKKQDAIWEFDEERNTLILSSFHLSNQNIQRYLEALKQYKPAYIRAHPSSIEFIARYMRDFNEFILSPTAILTSSETLFEFQRKVIEERFNCKIFDLYGLTEKVVLAGECEKHEGLHISPEYGVVEIVQDGLPVPPGSMGEIVATGLTNYIMPLLRYRTNDIGVLSEHICSCGRRFPLLKQIEGRKQEFFYLKDGSKVRGDVIGAHSKAFQNADQWQFSQRKKGELEIRIVKGINYSQHDTENIIEECDRMFKNRLGTSIVFVNEIERTARGKYRYFVNTADINNINGHS